MAAMGDGRDTCLLDGIEDAGHLTHVAADDGGDPVARSGVLCELLGGVVQGLADLVPTTPRHEIAMHDRPAGPAPRRPLMPSPAGRRVERDRPLRAGVRAPVLRRGHATTGHPDNAADPARGRCESELHQARDTGDRAVLGEPHGTGDRDDLVFAERGEEGSRALAVTD